MFTVLIVNKIGSKKLEASTKREALKLVPWSELKGGSGRIQKFDYPSGGLKGWLVSLSS